MNSFQKSPNIVHPIRKKFCYTQIMEDIKLVCFDMDDTLVQQNSWYTLNIGLGVTTLQDREMYEAYGAGTLNYTDWLKKLFSIYQMNGANQESIEKILSEYVLADGARELVSYLKDKGYELAIISGSIDTLVDAVANELQIGLRKGNTHFSYDDSGNLCDIQSEGEEVHAKLRHLSAFCNQLGIKLTQCVCIGDGANDIELFKATGKGVTFTSAPEKVQKEAWKIVKSFREIEGIL